MINENIVAFAKIQTGGDKTQRERSRPDERDFIRLAIQQLRREFPRFVQAMKHERFLIAERCLICAFGNRVGNVARQRTNARVREEDFSRATGNSRRRNSSFEEFQSASCEN